MVSFTSRFPRLICPQCTEESLKVASSLLHIECGSCGKQYELIDGKYPKMLTGETSASDEEVSVQDHAAHNYENLRYTDEWSRAYRDWIREEILSKVDVSGLILDNGCGIGPTIDGLAGKNVIGIDISTEAIRLAGKRTNRVLVADSQQIPFAEGTFDVVIARGVLHHLPDYEKGVSEIARVLQSDGEVVATDSNKSLLSTIPRAFAYKIFKDDFFSDDHQNLNRKRIITTFSQYFKIKEVSFYGYLAYPIAFPDIVNFFRFVPAKRFVFGSFMAIDRMLSCLPLIRTLGWTILVSARKQ